MRGKVREEKRGEREGKRGNCHQCPVGVMDAPEL